MFLVIFTELLSLPPGGVPVSTLFTAAATLNVSPDEYLIRVRCHVPRVSPLHFPHNFTSEHVTSVGNMAISI